MIFVAVGTQLPFDRLVRAVDQWAQTNPGTPIVAQIAEGTYQPQNMQWQPFMDADLFHKNIQDASLLVTHAGMGCIISALELGKPIIVMPRRADLGEHRNDHQLATASQFKAQGRIQVALDESELVVRLTDFAQTAQTESTDRIAAHASPQLLQVLRDFVEDETPRPPQSRMERLLCSFLQRASR